VRARQGETPLWVPLFSETQARRIRKFLAKNTGVGFPAPNDAHELNSFELKLLFKLNQ